MDKVLIICAAVLLAIIFITMAIVIYHQMLLTNEVNKRLLLIATEAIEKDRVDAEELKQALDELDKLSNPTVQVTQDNTTEEEAFNPYHDKDLDL